MDPPCEPTDLPELDPNLNPELTLHPEKRVYSRKLRVNTKKRKTPIEPQIDKDALPKDSVIAIIGSGIAGCASALTLFKCGFKNIIIYEKDTSFGQRRQGYGLTIQQAVSSLIELDVWEKVKELDTPAKCHLFFNKKGEIRGVFGRLTGRQIPFKAQKKYNVHVSRQDLRYVLMEQVEKRGIEIKWGHKLVDLKEDGDHVFVKFGDSKEKVDLVIGCDGVFSSVRRMYVDTPLEYLGVIVVLGIVYCDHYLLDQTCFESSDGRTRLYCMPFSQKSKSLNTVVQTMWQLSFIMDQDSATELSNDRIMLKKHILELMKDFHDPVPQMIQDTELENLMATPVFHIDPTIMEGFVSGRVALVGDALHPMSPFKSQGANRALIDSVSLAKHLSTLSLKDAFLQFKKDTFRSCEKVIVSKRKVETLHNGEERDYEHGEDEELMKRIKEGKLGSWTGRELFDKLFSSE